MKYIISFFLFFHSMSSIGQVDDIVLIKHIGESDKPIPTIIIYSKGMCSNPCVQSILALNKADIFLKKVIADTNWANVFVHALQDNITTKPNQKTYMFGSFEITCYQSQDCKKRKVIIDERKKSVAFFDAILKKISERNNEKNNELIESLENLNKRIRF